MSIVFSRIKSVKRQKAPAFSGLKYFWRKSSAYNTCKSLLWFQSPGQAFPLDFVPIQTLALVMFGKKTWHAKLAQRYEVRFRALCHQFVQIRLECGIYETILALVAVCAFLYT